MQHSLKMSMLALSQKAEQERVAKANPTGVNQYTSTGGSKGKLSGNETVDGALSSSLPAGTLEYRKDQKDHAGRVTEDQREKLVAALRSKDLVESVSDQGWRQFTDTADGTRVSISSNKWKDQYTVYVDNKGVKEKHSTHKSDLVQKANPNGINQYTKGKGSGDSHNPQDTGMSDLKGGAKTAQHQAYKIMNKLGDGLMYDDGEGNLAGPMTTENYKKAAPQIGKALENAGFKSKGDGVWESKTHKAKLSHDGDFIELDIKEKTKKIDLPSIFKL